MGILDAIFGARRSAQQLMDPAPVPYGPPPSDMSVAEARSVTRSRWATQVRLMGAQAGRDFVLLRSYEIHLELAIERECVDKIDRMLTKYQAILGSGDEGETET